MLRASMISFKTGAREPPLTAAKANLFSWEHGLIRETEAPRAATESRGFSIARSEADAPDIDGRVYIRGRLPAGEFAQVRVVGHTDYDLIAEPVR